MGAAVAVEAALAAALANSVGGTSLRRSWPHDELAAAVRGARRDAAFQAELDDLFRHYVGRPTPLYFARKVDRSVQEARASG